MLFFVKNRATGRNRLQLDERRAQLVELALTLFADRCYEDVSIGEIAKQAGISKGLLYHYFPSKRAFFAAAVEEAARQLLEVTGNDLTEPTGPDHILARMNAYLAFVEQRSASYVLLMRGRLGGDDAVQRIVDDTRQTFVDRIATTIGATLGGPVPQPVQIAIRGCVGFVEAASLAWLERGGMARTQLAHMLTQVCASTLESAMRGSVSMNAGPKS